MANTSKSNRKIQLFIKKEKEDRKSDSRDKERDREERETERTVSAVSSVCYVINDLTVRHFVYSVFRWQVVNWILFEMGAARPFRWYFRGS